VTTYGEALWKADRKRLNRTTAIRLDETKFVSLGTKGHVAYATRGAKVGPNWQVLGSIVVR